MRADARANRRALTDAARRLYSARGSAVPLSAVAREAGVGIATLYRNFPTHRDLITGLVGDVRDEVVELCARSLDAMRDDPVSAWPRFIDALVGLSLGSFLPAALEAQGTDLAPEMLAARDEVVRAVGTVLDIAKEAGLVRQDVPPERFHVGLGAITRPLPPAVPAQMPGLDAWIVETYLRGLRPDRP